MTKKQLKLLLEWKATEIVTILNQAIAEKTISIEEAVGPGGYFQQCIEWEVDAEVSDDN